MQTKSGWIKGVFVGCDHVPYHDKHILKERCAIIKAENPDFVIYGGDLFNADAGGGVYGRFYAGSIADLKDEYEASAVVLADYRRASGDAKKYWLEGNHESRVRTFDRIPNGFMGLADYRSSSAGALGEEWKKWEWRPYISPDRHLAPKNQGLVRIGQVSMLHGFQYGPGSDRDEAQLYGVDYGLTIRCHTHKPVPVTRAMLTTSVPTNRWYANAGTGADITQLKQDYACRRNTSLWGAGILVFTCNPNARGCTSRQWQASMIELD